MIWMLIIFPFFKHYSHDVCSCLYLQLQFKKNLLEAVVFYKCHCEHYVKGLVYNTYIFAHAFIQTLHYKQWSASDVWSENVRWSMCDNLLLMAWQRQSLSIKAGHFKRSSVTGRAATSCSVLIWCAVFSVWINRQTICHGDNLSRLWRRSAALTHQIDLIHSAVVGSRHVGDLALGCNLGSAVSRLLWQPKGHVISLRVRVGQGEVVHPMILQQGEGCVVQHGGQVGNRWRNYRHGQHPGTQGQDRRGGEWRGATFPTCTRRGSVSHVGLWEQFCTKLRSKTPTCFNTRDSHFHDTRIHLMNH